MASDIKEAIRRLFYQYKVEGADEVMAAQEAVAASTTKTDKASLSLEKSFGSLERRYVDTVRSQQDYAKVQAKVNAAVAQNPELQERANVVLAQAKQHFDNVATGATKADMAATVLIRTMSRTIGPLALVGVAVAAISSAMEFMEPIAVRVGADIYRRFSEAYPAIAQFADGIAKAGKEFIELEHAKAKAEAIDAAMRGVASAAQLAALKIQLVNDKLVDQRGQAEAELARQRMVAHVRELLQLYPGVTIETAKQLELMQAQLGVAQARTPAEATIAQEKLRQVQLTAQGLSAEEQQLIIAGERAIAEANATKQAAQQLQSLDDALRIANARGETEELIAKQIATQNRLLAEGKSLEDAVAIAAKERQVAEAGIKKQEEAQAKVTHEVDNTTDAIDRSVDATKNLIPPMIIYVRWWHDLLSITDAVNRNLYLLKTQFAGEQYTSTWDPLHALNMKAALERQYGAENVKAVNILGSGANANDTIYIPDTDKLIAAAQAEHEKALAQVGDPFQAITSKFSAESVKQSIIDSLIQSLDGLTSSTDSLNATMQNALSPFYSQDPRTTKLGFRAGTVGNPDWLAAGASNANPLAAILGPGATAPGMAGGGSFIVGGGYSANDNRIAAFPVASGEEVVVNRNRGQGRGGQVVHIDNRIIVTGTIDADTMGKLKVSKYQQAQRMRAGLAQAS